MEIILAVSPLLLVMVWVIFWELKVNRPKQDAVYRELSRRFQLTYICETLFRSATLSGKFRGHHYQCSAVLNEVFPGRIEVEVSNPYNCYFWLEMTTFSILDGLAQILRPTTVPNVKDSWHRQLVVKCKPNSIAAQIITPDIERKIKQTWYATFELRGNRLKCEHSRYVGNINVNPVVATEYSMLLLELMNDLAMRIETLQSPTENTSPITL